MSRERPQYRVGNTQKENRLTDRGRGRVRPDTMSLRAADEVPFSTFIGVKIQQGVPRDTLGIPRRQRRMLIIRSIL